MAICRILVLLDAPSVTIPITLSLLQSGLHACDIRRGQVAHERDFVPWERLIVKLWGPFERLYVSRRGEPNPFELPDPHELTHNGCDLPVVSAVCRRRLREGLLFLPRRAAWAPSDAPSHALSYCDWGRAEIWSRVVDRGLIKRRPSVVDSWFSSAA